MNNPYTGYEVSNENGDFDSFFRFRRSFGATLLLRNIRFSTLSLFNSSITCKADGTCSDGSGTSGIISIDGDNFLLQLFLKDYYYSFAMLLPSNRLVEICAVK